MEGSKVLNLFIFAKQSERFYTPPRIYSMILIDISRDLASCPLYPGTWAPEIEVLQRMDADSDYHLSRLHAELHTGTHVDAPMHFLQGGKDVASLDLHHFVGPCLVLEHWESLPQSVAPIVLLKNQSDRPLFPADCERFFKAGIRTIGTDALSLTVADAETPVHRFLLQQEMAIIEHLDLSSAPEGAYFLAAAPIKISGAEASFCRAILIKHANADSFCR